MYLYLDLNSFFASCEQQSNPGLRGKPVAVVPLMADSTCAIAASYEAKRYGVKTGTSIREARAMCPGLQLVQASHRRYVEYHHRVIAAIEHCVPVEKVMSIDEVVCKLTGMEAEPQRAVQLAQAIKATIRREVGECLTSSVGIAPNRLLAKIASNLHKPDGLVVLQRDQLPGPLAQMRLGDITGIGYNMVKRLHRFGIYDVEQLYAASAQQLKAVWGGVLGLRFHAKLHGEDIDDFAAHPTRSIGHQHVLEPVKRHSAAALQVTQQLLEKAAERMRSEGFFATRLSVQVKLLQHGGYRYAERDFAQTQHTGQLLNYLEGMWAQIKAQGPLQPLRVGVTLSGLVAAAAVQMDMFSPPKNDALLRAVDHINHRYGRGTLHFGQASSPIGRSDKIAFQRVPELYEVS